MSTTAFRADVIVEGSIEEGQVTVTMIKVEDPEPPDPNPNPNPEPEPGYWEPPEWLRTDIDAVEIPDVPVPNYGQTQIDKVFMSRITRVSGDPGDPVEGIDGMTWPDVSGHHYNSDQAWNADQSLIYLDNPGIFIDGKAPFKPRFGQNNKPSDADVRWHPDNPALMVYAAGSVVGTWNPKEGSQRTLMDFGGAYSGCKFGPWEGALSEDGEMVAISCTYEGQFTAFSYNLVTGEKGNNIWASEVHDGKCDAVKISASGLFMVWTFDPDTSVVTDLDGEVVLTLENNWISHFDVCIDDSGEDCIVGRDNSNGMLAKTMLRDGERTYLSEGGWCSHTSARQQTRHRWAVTAPTDEGGSYDYGGEVIMAELDGSKVYRLCHTHTPRENDYKAEVQPSHSRDGTMVIFKSAWGGSGSEPRPVGCYVVEFRE